ncbi:MAG: MBOAT family O-acyltransferase [Myxococcota bacterium]
MIALTLLVFVTVWNLHFVRERGSSAWPSILAALAMPLCVDWQSPFLRAPVTVWAVVFAMKSWELSRGNVADPRMLHGLGRALFWQFIPPDTQVPDDNAQAAATRAVGLARVRRGLLKTPFALALWWLEMRWPGVHDNPWCEAFWALWLTWLGMTAFVDVLSGIAMQSGFHVAETFETPLFARSPRDFWGRRWNLFVHRWVRRHIFRPVGGVRHPLRGAALVFVYSALVHEYVVVAALRGLPRGLGWMSAFFVLHGLAVGLEIALIQRLGRGPWMPRALAVGLHLLWLTATAPLFFGPLGEIFVQP